MSPPILAILFDFDGVLVNSEMLHLQAFQQAARDAGIELSEQEYFQHCIGFDDRGVWRQIAKLRGVTLDNPTLLGLLTYKAEVARSLIGQKKYTALPGVTELVRGLWRHYPLGICSGALREEIELMLEGIGLRDCFLTITAAEDVTRGKPDPEGYRRTAAELARRVGKSIRPANALIFEDAPRVIATAKKAGFQTAGVPTHYGHDQLRADFAPRSLKVVDVQAAIPSLEILVG